MVKKKVTKKIRLADLLGKEGKANADLYKDDPEKRAKHIRHRKPRQRLVNLKGDGYTGSLGGGNDAKKDILLHEVAREWINNGLNQTSAYAAVFGVSLASAKCPASKLFNSSWFRSKLWRMMGGADGELADLPKEYFFQRQINILESNILDYVGDDGRWLTIEELRELPEAQQVMIEDLNMVNNTRPMALTDQHGNVVKDDNGEPYMVEVKDQRVRIRLPDKHKAMELLAKGMKWVATQQDQNTVYIHADIMIAAEARIKELSKDEIQGTAERIATD
jgi:hypothetical protein